MQRVLDRSVWDVEVAGDDLRAFVIEQLGDPEGVVVVDETGFLKQGRHSVGVKHQYSGTAGHIESCQIGVFLAYASSTGRAGLDRALYLPQEWADDGERRAAAGVPEVVGFQTTPQLALGMLPRVLDGGVPAAWVTADEVYGNDFTVRRGSEARGHAYVVAGRRMVPSATHGWKNWRGLPTRLHGSGCAAARVRRGSASPTGSPCPYGRHTARTGRIPCSSAAT